MTPNEAFFELILNPNSKDKKRLENIIKKDAESSYHHSLYSNKRFEEGEQAISTNIQASFYYAINIIKDRLPDWWHNKMIIYFMDNPKNKYLIEYFKTKEHWKVIV